MDSKPMLSEIMKNCKELKRLTGASMVWCKEAYDKSSYDFDKALELVIERVKKEGRTFTLPTIDKQVRPKYGRTVADVSITKDIGVIVGLSCFSEATAKSQVFIDLLDKVVLVALKEQPKTGVELLSCGLSGTFGITKYAEIQTVEEMLESASAITREDIELDYYKLILQTFAGGDRITLYPYNHHNGQICSICTVMVSDKGKEKDTEWLKHRVASAIACYNPLVIHEYTLCDSILEYVAEEEKKENRLLLSKSDSQVMEEQSRWKLESFLDTVVLDRIKIPAMPFQELNRPKDVDFLVCKPMSEVCHDNGIVIMDFERFQTEIHGLII